MAGPGVRQGAVLGQTRRYERPTSPEPEQPAKVVVVGPDGVAVETDAGGGLGRERPVTEMVEQPAKVMRVGSMIRQLLEEVRAAPLDETSRARLKEIHPARSRNWRTASRPSLSRSSNGSRCRSPTTRCRARPSSGSPRLSWSAGSRACSTGSRPPCSRSRWPRGRSSSRCGGRCRPAWCLGRWCQGRCRAQAATFLRSGARGPASYAFRRGGAGRGEEQAGPTGGQRASPRPTNWRARCTWDRPSPPVARCAGGDLDSVIRRPWRSRSIVSPVSAPNPGASGRAASNAARVRQRWPFSGWAGRHPVALMIPHICRLDGPAEIWAVPVPDRLAPLPLAGSVGSRDLPHRRLG